MIKNLLFTMLLSASLAVAEEGPAIRVTPMKDAVGRDAFRISDGKTEAIVVPEIARVMAFQRVGGTNWLWNAPPGKVDFMGWQNHGGEKAWVSPQGTWPAFLGHDFPPDVAWEAGHQAQVLDNPPRLQTISLPSKCGIKLIREFSFSAKGEFVTSTTLEKTDEIPLMAGAWTITQIPPVEAVFLPTSDASAYKNNFYSFSRKPIGNIVNVTSTLVRVIPTEAGAYKIGVDAPIIAIAAVRNGEAFVQRADHAQGKYPDGADESGFPVELFDLGSKGLHYIELELLSPVKPMVKGKRLTFVVRWSLHALPSSDVESAETRKAIDNLFHP